MQDGIGKRERGLAADRRAERRNVRTIALLALLFVTLTQCTTGEMPMEATRLREFATWYTAAWCSHDAARVASFFAENGSLTINDGNPSVGRAAIAAAAQGFMTAFPDMVVKMDGLDRDGGRIAYQWTLSGTNTGPGGTGKAVRISGHEQWTLTADGLIASSQGHYDAAEYQRQLKAGVVTASP